MPDFRRAQCRGWLTLKITGRAIRWQSSPNRLRLQRNDANGGEPTPCAPPWGPFATARYAPAGFRFRRGNPWGFKSLLEH